MYTTIIFDLDGTLLDTIPDLAASMNHSLVVHDLNPLPVENYNHYLGDGVYMLAERVLHDQPDPAHWEDCDQLKKDLIYTMKEAYTHRWNQTTKPYPGIVDLLDALRREGCRLAVVSNKPHDSAVQMTEYFFGSDCFDMILGQREGVPVKPAPHGVNDVIAHLALDRSQILYVGDTNTDMETAKNADLTSIGVAWGFRSVEELTAHGAQFVVHEAKEILDIFLA